MALASAPIIHLADCGSQPSPAEPVHGLGILSAALQKGFNPSGLAFICTNPMSSKDSFQIRDCAWFLISERRIYLVVYFYTSYVLSGISSLLFPYTLCSLFKIQPKHLFCLLFVLPRGQSNILFFSVPPLSSSGLNCDRCLPSVFWTELMPVVRTLGVGFKNK